MLRHHSLGLVSPSLVDLKKRGYLAGLICEECRISSDTRLQDVEARVAEYVSGQVLNILSAVQAIDVITLAWSTRNLFESALLYHWVSSKVKPLQELDGWLAKDLLDIHNSLDILRRMVDTNYVPDNETEDRRIALESRIKPAKKGAPKFLRIEDLAKDPEVNRGDEYDARFKLLSKLTHCSPYSLFGTRTDNWDAPLQLLTDWAAQYSLELVCRIGLKANSQWVNQHEADAILRGVTAP